MMPDAMGIKIYVCYVVRGRLEGSVTANIGWYDLVSILHDRQSCSFDITWN